jgi:NADH-quinone oxidoreductase subunit F
MGVAREAFPITKDHRVAVVGAGPAGMTCGYYLAKAGYLADVFESQPVAGGMLAIALPEFRLPREIIEEEIRYINNCGVKIHHNSPIDARRTINDLGISKESSLSGAAPVLPSPAPAVHRKWLP